MCLSSMAFILLGLVINQDGSEPPYQMSVSCLTKLLGFVFSFFMLIWCLTRPLFINGDRPVAVVSLTNHHLCFTQQVQRISLWCSTQQSNPQDTTRPQGKTTRPSYGANFHFSPPADFTATQVVPIPFQFHFVHMFVPWFYFPEQLCLYLKQTLGRSLLLKGQTEMCESHHWKCF